ncbi:MAG: sulfurtransferase TusA family protein [Deltaproteobacteria bacterium]|nr:sulfurtransferase TusA family protein [Deltaproteobacteria bacterium]
MPVKTLDVRGEICPDPLTLTMKEIEGLNLGDRLKVTLDSPMALETITRWAEKAGHRVLEVREAGAGEWEITLEKR